CAFSFRHAVRGAWDFNRHPDETTFLHEPFVNQIGGPALTHHCEVSADIGLKVALWIRGVEIYDRNICGAGFIDDLHEAAWIRACRHDACRLGSNGSANSFLLRWHVAGVK